MSTFWKPMLALLWKDILLELRSKDIIVSVFVFALLVIVIFNFALDPTPGVDVETLAATGEVLSTSASETVCADVTGVWNLVRLAVQVPVLPC